MRAHGCFPRPDGTFQALLSAHFVAAVVLHERAAWLDQFGPSRYEDPALRRFAEEQVEVMADPDLPLESCRVEARLLDGREVALRTDVAKGDPANPVSREELAGKFRQCATGRMAPPEIERVLEQLLRIEEVGSIAELPGVTPGWRTRGDRG